MARIIVIGGNVHSLVQFRGDMIQQMVEDGNEVFAMAPATDLEGEAANLMTQKVSSKLQTIGVPYLPIPLNRTGINPVKDLHTILWLSRKIGELKPDVVLAYTMKPVIYGSIAARLAGVEDVFSMITGLGYVFTGDSMRQLILAKIVIVLYKIALAFNRKVYFMNPDDRELFRKLRILADNGKAVLIHGSGVNIDHYSFKLPQTRELVFLIIARLLWDKGIGEFVSAARLLKKKYPAARFQIVGPFDNNPSAIRRSDVATWQAEGVIEYLGATADVRPYLENASVYVLPSYREGTPRSVLEAMATGRPVITTDAPGCRETVVDGVNGFLVPVRDSEALAAAMEKFCRERDLIAEMGRKGREIAEARYDVHKVNHTILRPMDLDRFRAQCPAGRWSPVSRSSKA